jgi:thiol-disulfide isomerase/thioredoxin
VSKRNLIVALTAAAVLAPAALAQHGDATAAQPAAAAPAAKAPTLKVGDKAPALTVANWVKGDQVTGFEKGKVYVVEFWATWCGPCKASIPHLTALQKEYKDKGVTIIGMTSKDPNNSLEAVQQMVKDRGDEMNYTVAFDDARKTNEAYMKASGQRGIPTAFIVDKESKLAWIGHPMEMDAVLGHVVAGTWTDEMRTKLETEKKNAMGDSLAFQEALESNDPAKILAVGPKMISKLGTNGAAMNQLAWTIVDPKGKIAPTLKDNPKLLDLAFEAAQKAEKASPKDGAILDTVARVYFIKGDKAKAIEIQKKAVSLADASMKAELEANLKEFESAK